MLSKKRQLPLSLRYQRSFIVVVAMEVTLVYKVIKLAGVSSRCVERQWSNKLASQ